MKARRSGQGIGEPVVREVPDLVGDISREFRQLIPGAVVDGKLDLEKLQLALGFPIASGAERFMFSWTGRQDSARLLQMPTRATLRTVRDKSVDIGTTENLFIEGDNLEVLKLLYKPFFGQVKMIYIDPPYNTGSDFVYPDNYSDPLHTYLRLSGQSDSEGNLLSSNPETSGRFHSAWLSMMYPRLFLSRILLRDDGLIFVSIDDNEVANLRLLMNEIFGEENFVDTIVWKKRYGGGAKEKYLVSLHEYILVYARDLSVLPPIFISQSAESIERYYTEKDENLALRGPYRTHPLEATKSMGDRPNLRFPIRAPDGSEVLPKRQWLWKKERVARALAKGEIAFLKDKNGNWSVHSKQYLKDETGTTRLAKAFSVIDDIFTQHGTNEIIELFGDAQVFPFPKPTALIQRLVEIGAPGSDDIVLDFFAGSGTAAQAVLQVNRADGGQRRFIMVQLPEATPEESAARKKGFSTISEIGAQRIRLVLKTLRHEARQKLPTSHESAPEDLGFQFLTLGESNLVAWTGVDERSSRSWNLAMQRQVDPLIDGWKTDDVVLEVAMKEGLTPVLKLERRKDIPDNVVTSVSDDLTGRRFTICLDNKVKTSTVRALGLSKEDTFVCKDVALDDTGAANLALQCRLKTI